MQHIAEYMDSSAEAVTAGLQSLGKMAGEAGLGVGKGAKMFEKLGISATDSNGKVRDTVEILKDVGDRMKGLGKGEQMALASKLGLDSSLVDMLINDTAGISEEFYKMTEASGIAWNEAGADAGKFADELKKMKTTFGLVWKSIATSFFKKFAESFEKITKMVISNMPKIINTIKPIISVFVEITGLLGSMAGRLVAGVGKIIDIFLSVNKATDGWALGIAGLGIAWLAINRIFAMSPLGRIIVALMALGVVIELLIDDFEVWKEGGESAIDWGNEYVKMVLKFGEYLGYLAVGLGVAKVAMLAFTAASNVNPFVLAITGIVLLTTLILSLKDDFDFLGSAIDFWSIVIGDAVDSSISAFRRMVEFFKVIYNTGKSIFSNLGEVINSIIKTTVALVITSLTGIIDWFKELPSRIAESLGGIGSMIKGAFSGAMNISPNISPVSMAGATNRSIAQSTNINVNGAINPAQTGQAVIAGQERVNNNLTRNFNGGFR
jgi:hypothetical protein